MPMLYSRELPTMLRVSHIASYLDISMKSAYQLVKTPGFPLVPRLTKGWRIPRDAFLEWLEANLGSRKLNEYRASHD
jgi:hypothetical protein